MSGAGRVTAIVLAGGLGTRLREVTQNKYPKPLVPVGIGAARAPFLEFAMAPLQRQGIGDFILCIGHLGQQVVDHFGDGREYGINIRYSDSGSADTGTRVHSAFALSGGAEALVVCGDVFHPVDVADFMRRFRERPDWKVQLAATEQTGPQAPNMVLAPDGSVLAHGDSAGPSGRAALETGVLAVRSSAFDGYRIGTDFSLAGDLFPALARERALGSMIQPVPFFDIGTPERLHRFRAFAGGGGASPLAKADLRRGR